MLQDYLADLSHLVGFGVAAIALQVQSFGHTCFAEDVMASPYALDEPQPQQQGA